MPTYVITRTEKGWIIQKCDDRPGWIGTPFRIGDPYPSKKKALTVAHLLAGRSAKVVVADELVVV